VSDFDWSQIVIHTRYFPGAWPKLEDLRTTLQSSAGHHARTALAHYIRTDERHVDAAYHCGAAVEHLAKAYLASLHPVLIVERGDFDSMLVLTGHEQHAKRSRGTEIRTVGLEEACKRVRQVLPAFNPEPAVQVIGNVRNAAAHLGVTRHSDIRRAVQMMVSLLAPLLDGLGTGHDSFWGESAGLATTLRDDALAQIERIVASKVESARQTFARRVAGLDETAREAVLRAIAGKPHWTQDYETSHPCPVCAQPGLLSCQFWIDEDDQRPDPADAEGAMPHVYALVNGFYCSVCELELDDGDETRAQGMPDEFDLGHLPLDEYGWPIANAESG
jgi:hypothetical protein